ncbi:MAG: hypothetical protein LH618_19695, partial [Saprospiraceae bacterium]|nr:hypothetical protein [Saprospiraceae bacterium]
MERLQEILPVVFPAGIYSVFFKQNIQIHGLRHESKAMLIGLQAECTDDIQKYLFPGSRKMEKPKRSFLLACGQVPP